MTRRCTPGIRYDPRYEVGRQRHLHSIMAGSRIYVQRKVDLWRGRSFSCKFGLWDKLLRTDLTTAVPTLELPVYFFHGQYDYTCSYDLARQYFRRLDAPLKGFYTFERSAPHPCSKKPKRRGAFCGRTYWQDRRRSLTRRERSQVISGVSSRGLPGGQRRQSQRRADTQGLRRRPLTPPQSTSERWLGASALVCR